MGQEQAAGQAQEKKGWSGLKIFLALSAGLVGCGTMCVMIFVGGSCLVIGSAANEVAEKQKTELARIKAAPISDVTWEEIDKIYNLKSGMTEIQKNEHWKRYKGKKVKWQGTVSSVSETFGTLTLQVKMNSSSFTSDVLVRLKPTERSSAVNIQKGTTVSYIGILDSWGSLMPVTIDHGEIAE